MVKYCLNKETGLVRPGEAETSPLPINPRGNTANVLERQRARLPETNEDIQGFKQIHVDFNELPLELRHSLFNKVGKPLVL